jgi:hypothetical protein
VVDPSGTSKLEKSPLEAVLDSAIVGWRFNRTRNYPDAEEP